MQELFLEKEKVSLLERYIFISWVSLERGSTTFPSFRVS